MSTPSNEQVIQVHNLANELLSVLGSTTTTIALDALLSAYLNVSHQRGCLDQVPGACDALAKAAAHLQSESNEMPAHLYAADVPPSSSLH